MVFSSLIFLYGFLPVLLLVYFAARSAAWRNWVLILFSFAFYAWGEPVWIALLLLAAMAGYLFALGIEKTRGTAAAKALYIAAIALNIGLLGFFKYAGFLADNLNAVLPFHVPRPDVSLPIGISFFTFEIICYLTDVYKGAISAPRSPRKILLYVSFFPHLVAGPVIRYADIERQIDRPDVSLAGFSEGITRFLIGLGKKVIFANLLGEIVPELLDPGSGSASVLGLWLGACFFALQIYFDFSGYSDIAIGLGKMFGFRLRENFNYPYVSRSASEFWRRWNMSLGGFFRDYVYIPLGGNRKFYARNLFIVWFLTGFWHGASWNFIVWGLYFGLLIYAERKWLGKLLERVPPFFAHLYATLAMLAGWVWFYFTDLSQAIRTLLGMAGLRHLAWANTEMELIFRENGLLLLAAVAGCTPLLPWALRRLFGRYPKLETGLGVAGGQLLNAAILAVSTILLVGSTYNPFLYYRF